MKISNRVFWASTLLGCSAIVSAGVVAQGVIPAADRRTEFQMRLELAESKLGLRAVDPDNKLSRWACSPRTGGHGASSTGRS